MSTLYLWIALVLAAALGWWAWRRPASRPMSAPASTLTAFPPQPTRTPRSARPAPVATVVPAAPPAEPVPPELAALVWQRETDLETSRREVLLATIRGIPRPPGSLQQLLSPEFVARASSAELSELVMAEPLIAAKVLGTVNAPFYGLHRPVNGVGQAVTFLGMNTVRNICLQYMLAEAFKPRLASSKRVFDEVWKASAIASELSVRLGKALNLPDQGGLATQVVLGFVGHLATASLMPPEALDSWLSRHRVDRTAHEQAVMDLSASEIGGLLLKSWSLPDALIADVGDIGRLLVTPVGSIEPARVPRLALSYLCSRLGERLALGQLPSLADYDATQDLGPDTHHLRSCLAHPALAGLNAALQAPELHTALQLMLDITPRAK
ncbi:HDOD domain-containing protein [Hydrogenophaga sp.]|uniref:HDOD domain-containing protein n=1 Tax=Hydrogenophaga sp. TaxID=1904254 RepID=UPI0025C42B64|nr:HDOD domain-containing protein [Hydrogenophaga sp.]